MVWVGSREILSCIMTLLKTYLLFKIEQIVEAIVGWDDGIMYKKMGGLSLTSLEDAMTLLMSDLALLLLSLTFN